MVEANPKSLNIFIDGTWQTDEQEEPTNITKLYRALDTHAPDGKTQLKFYYDGIGTRGGWLRQIFQGAFAHDLESLVKQAYKDIALNYTPGDKINLYGFSRGATAARMLAGLIDHAGFLNMNKIPDKDLDKVIDEAWDLYRQTGDFKYLRDFDKNRFQVETALFRQKHSHNDDQGSHESIPHIDHMLLFDTVGSLGVPEKFFTSNLFALWNPKLGNDYWRFHDDTIPHIVDRVTHFIALDEKRESFSLTGIKNNFLNDTKIKNIYFRGDHSAIGGGVTEKRGLSDFIGKRAAQELSDSIGFNEHIIQEEFDLANPDSFLLSTDQIYKRSSWLLRAFTGAKLRKPPKAFKDGDDNGYNIEEEVDIETLKAFYERTSLLPENFNKNPDLALQAFKYLFLDHLPRKAPLFRTPVP